MCASSDNHQMASVALGTLWDYNTKLEVLGPGPLSFLVPQGVVPYRWQIIPACIFVEHRLVNPYLDSLTPLLNRFGSTSRILTLAKLMLWSRWSQFMYFKTSVFTELDFLCSMNLAFRNLPVSQMHVSSQFSQLMWYSEQTNPILDRLVFQLHQYLSKHPRTSNLALYSQSHPSSS